MRVIVALIALLALIALFAVPGASLPRTTLRARNRLEAILWLLASAMVCCAARTRFETRPEAIHFSAAPALPAQIAIADAVLLC
jgi:hypothetical protein